MEVACLFGRLGGRGRFLDRQLGRFVQPEQSGQDALVNGVFRRRRVAGRNRHGDLRCGADLGGDAEKPWQVAGLSAACLFRPDGPPVAAVQFELVAWSERVGRRQAGLVDSAVRVLERYK